MKGVFTTMRVHNGVIENYELHIKRLQEHARFVGIHFDGNVKDLFDSFLEKNDVKNGTFRFKVSVIESIDSKYLLKLQLFPYTQDFLEKKLVLLNYEPTKPPGIKTICYDERHLLYQKAQQLQFDDCIVQDEAGILLESSYANVFWVHDGAIFTPSKALPILYGTMIRTIESRAQSLSFSFLQGKFLLSDIPQSASLYLCNSIIWFLPVVRISERTFERNLKFEINLRKELTRLLNFT